MSKVHHYRVVIETQSPMAINTGGRETGFDAQLARDANGLPYIPATAVAGVWSHLVESRLGKDVRKLWFGSTEVSSVLTITNGLIHDSKNCPVTGLRSQQSLTTDPLLALMTQERPLHRERVRINDRGVAADTGKFDQLLLPKGVRFSLSIDWHDNAAKELQVQWPELLACWGDRRFALGASTRNGLGQIRVVACEYTQADLSSGPQSGRLLQDARKLDKVPTTLDASWPTDDDGLLFASLPLKALDNWRCGAGSVLLGEENAEVDILTYSEAAVSWSNNVGKLGDAEPVLCGSSIKGMLAHRIAYHYRRHSGDWAEQKDQAIEQAWQQEATRYAPGEAEAHKANFIHQQWELAPQELSAIFGLADEEHDNSLAGKLFVDDCPVSFQHTVIRQHNSIDRFTGGVRQGALFNEQLLYQPEFTLKLWVAPDNAVSPALSQAIIDTLDDLKHGLLPLGAGSGRGASLVEHHQEQPWLVNESTLNVVAVAEEAGQ